MQVNIAKRWHNPVGYYYTLDKHIAQSEYVGDWPNGNPRFDTAYTDSGKLVNSLKYKGDYSGVTTLANLVRTEIVPMFGVPIHLVIPMPASTVRPRQPVTEVARELASQLKVKSFENIILKTKSDESSEPLKNVAGMSAKLKALEGRFYLNDGIADGCWNAILIDDLYDDGATMQVAVQMLRSYDKINKVFYVALTRTGKT